MKKILIVSELFYPQNAIGALRPTKIRNALVKKGYLVDVITKSFSSQYESPERGNIWRIDAVEKSNSLNSNVSAVVTSKFFKEFRCAKRTIIAINKGKHYYNHVIDFIETQNIDLSVYEAILTTFGPISSIMIGLNIKKKYPEINWICDFRDPMVVEEISVFMKPFMYIFQRMACKNANHIVAVSNGYLKRICGNQYKQKRHMIPNGYDITDKRISDDYSPSVDTLHITYVGTLYEGKRKITPFFRVLRELADEGQVDLHKICFDYAGREGSFLISQANEYDLGSIVHDHGVLPRNECLKLQFSSHLLVLSTWNNRGEEGVFPGKFLEYMLIGRPIISITDGNIPDGEVTLVMREGHFGVAYESARDKEDIKSLKDYIKTCYFEWLHKGSITFEPVQEVLERYNYDHIIEQIEELICEK